MISRRRIRFATLTLASLLLASTISEAGNPFKRRGVVVRPTVAVTVPANPHANDNAPTPMLGTFYSTPYMTVRGDGPVGSGYTPFGQNGVNTLSVYGPLSAYRSTAAPVTVYSRGYNGALIPSQGTSFSTPNQPEATNVVYPTPAINSDHPRPARMRSSWPSAINWIDQN